jgi:SAM-dependent methyltransferase
LQNFFEKESIDLMTAFSVFHLVPNPVPVFKQLHQVLKSGGKIIGTLPYVAPLLKPKHHLYNLWMFLKWRVPLPSRKEIIIDSVESCEKLLKEAAFSDVNVHLVDSPVICMGFEELRDW